MFRLIVWGVLLLTTQSFSYTIAVYEQNPIADKECAKAIFDVLSLKHKCEFLNHQTLTTKNLKKFDCLVFPGGIGDVDNFDYYLKDKQKIVQQFFNSNKIYIGICMGAYFADSHYFGIVQDIKIEQYISRKRSEIKTETPTTIKCLWQNKMHIMYFFDGPVFLGKIKQQEKIALYQNNEVAAIVKKINPGIFIGIGPHPESTNDWYDTKKLKPYWHHGEQHQLILDLLDKVDQ